MKHLLPGLIKNALTDVINKELATSSFLNVKLGDNGAGQHAELQVRLRQDPVVGKAGGIVMKVAMDFKEL